MVPNVALELARIFGVIDLWLYTILLVFFYRLYKHIHLFHVQIQFSSLYLIVDFQPNYWTTLQSLMYRKTVVSILKK